MYGLCIYLTLAPVSEKFSIIDFDLLSYQCILVFISLVWPWLKMKSKANKLMKTTSADFLRCDVGLAISPGYLVASALSPCLGSRRLCIKHISCLMEVTV